jgi:hypothetical protein
LFYDLNHDAFGRIFYTFNGAGSTKSNIYRSAVSGYNGITGGWIAIGYAAICSLCFYQLDTQYFRCQIGGADKSSSGNDAQTGGAGNPFYCFFKSTVIRTMSIYINNIFFSCIWKNNAYMYIFYFCIPFITNKVPKYFS